MPWTRPGTSSRPWPCLYAHGSSEPPLQPRSLWWTSWMPTLPARPPARQKHARPQSGFSCSARAQCRACCKFTRQGVMKSQLAAHAAMMMCACLTPPAMHAHTPRPLELWKLLKRQTHFHNWFSKMLPVCIYLDHNDLVSVSVTLRWD